MCKECSIIGKGHGDWRRFTAAICTRHHQVIIHNFYYLEWIWLCARGSVGFIILSSLYDFFKVIRQVKLEQQESEYFGVIGPKDARSKVAPGLSIDFTVIFTPHENKVPET